MSYELEFQRLSHSTHTRKDISTLIGPDKKDFSYLTQLRDTIPDAFSNAGCDYFSEKVDRDLHNLWKRIDALYFRPITPNDLNQIESLISQLSTIHSEESLTSPQAIDTLQAASPNADSFIEYEDSKQGFESILIEKEDLNYEMDEITKELNMVTTNQHITHVQNVQQLLELKDKLAINQDKRNIKISENILLHESVTQKDDNTEFVQLPSHFDKEKATPIEINYLKDLILELEEMQTAESIKCVVDCRKASGLDDYEFCVIFDEALIEKAVWIPEAHLDKLDALREQGLFKLCHIPQKTRRSLNTYNIAGMHSCNQKMIHWGLEIKEKSWKNLIKKTLGDRGNDPFNRFFKEQMTSKVKCLGLCHQCRYLFSDESLVHCNYKSSKMGLFTVESPYESLAAAGARGTCSKTRKAEQNENLSYIYKWKEEKNEYICDRKFCRNCLKSNYDLSPQEILQKKDWICPFCQSSCFCSRCLRHDHIKKLARKYLSFGENLQEIISKSSLQRYIRASFKKSFEYPQIQIEPKESEAKKKKGRKPNTSQDPALKKKVKKSTNSELIKPQAQTQSKRGRPRKDRSYIPGFEFVQTQEETIPGSKKHFYRTTEADSDWEFKLDFEKLENKDSTYPSSIGQIDLDAFRGIEGLFDGEEIFMDDGLNLKIENSKPQIWMEAPLSTKFKPQKEPLKKRGRGRPRKVDANLFKALESNQDVTHWGN